MSVESLKVQIIKKAWEDPEFKQLLLADPQTALKQEFGVDIPEGVELKVVEETASSFYLVIPPEPSADDNLKYSWT
ncbi:NHLP leader peptide family RiPP precursor [Cohnella fermenti]|uniref:NHLP leader peptide family natural product n=1 Tax=Cohnella fermenti TaxID=2565925 RepID=A0A4S4C1Y1_9BACL|nr:NHLP leader peptide family RiPP precursor [Cohnella fermenti]THF81671.1 NHLP leader peptide family natural product precursor [Cohnella fermenti]